MSVVTSGIEQLTCLLLSVSDVQFGRLGSRVVLTCGGAHDGYVPLSTLSLARAPLELSFPVRSDNSVLNHPL